MLYLFSKIVRHLVRYLHRSSIICVVWIRKMPQSYQLKTSKQEQKDLQISGVNRDRYTMQYYGRYYWSLSLESSSMGPRSPESLA